MKEKWKIALAQLNCEEGNKESNLLKMENAIEMAYNEGADILVMPEMFLTGFVSRDKLEHLAESRQGASFKRIQKKLAEFPLHFVYTFPEYAGKDIIYNTTSFINRDTKNIQYYRKIHLFDDERMIVNRSNEWTEVVVEGVKFGLLTCYDIEFPEASRVLALKGVKVILTPSANMTPYEHRHRTFITSRAMENHVFVVYCNRVGENSKYKYKGESVVISPDGRVVMEIPNSVEAIRMAEINIREVEESKSIFNYLEERRPELY